MGFEARSDLATECGCENEREGIRVSTADAGGCKLVRVQIKSEDAARRIGKPCGRYVTLECGHVHDLCEQELAQVRRVLAVELREMAERMTGKRMGSGFSVLVAGLGNAEITPDAVGPETVRRLSVTRHLREYDTALFSTVGLCEIAAIAPGVLGQTGLETVELVRGAVSSAKPDLVVAVDALAARSTERLAATVQLSDTGIQPGSGIGNGRRALNRETVGVPVMALGVPTVVESSTLVYDALTKFGIDEQREELQQLFEGGKGFFVAPKEIDLLIPSVGILLSSAIEKAFTVS
ncbi:MAG: GPR endopeptidase [Ruminococcaceae bacterium]|nr:GPR endopeptidase [Oscillospiraceae bacterium]